MYRQVIPHVLNSYGINEYSLGTVQKGYRNESYPVTLTNGTTINLLFFKHEPGIINRIRRADYVADQAAARGLSVRTRYDQRIITVAKGRYAGLYHYLSGSTVAWEAFTMRHVKLLGMAMGDLHASLALSTQPDNHSISDELLPLIKRMEIYFDDESVARAMESKLGLYFDNKCLQYFRRAIEHIATLPGQQMIHMDMVRGNVLFDGARTNERWRIDDLTLTGIIDFEKATYGHPLFDLARTLAFLLVDSSKPSEKIYRYFIDSGYVKRAGRQLPDEQLLTILIQFFLIHDLYKFLRHTPYESLRDNYHYSRTSTVMEQYGMISLKH